MIDDRKIYKAPNFEYWSADKLNTIEAQMSGGSGGGSGSFSTMTVAGTVWPVYGVGNYNLTYDTLSLTAGENGASWESSDYYFGNPLDPYFKNEETHIFQTRVYKRVYLNRIAATILYQIVKDRSPVAIATEIIGDNLTIAGGIAYICGTAGVATTAVAVVGAVSAIAGGVLAVGGLASLFNNECEKSMFENFGNVNSRGACTTGIFFDYVGVGFADSRLVFPYTWQNDTIAVSPFCEGGEFTSDIALG